MAATVPAEESLVLCSMRWLGCGGVSWVVMGSAGMLWGGWVVSWRFLCCSCHLAFTGKCQHVCRRKTDVENKLADLLGLREA